MTIYLLTPLPGSSTRTLCVSSPDESLVLPMHRDGSRHALSFTRNSYYKTSNSSVSQSSASSSRSLLPKQTELDQWFGFAMKRMRQANSAEDTDDEDDLPVFLSSFTSYKRDDTPSSLSLDSPSPIGTDSPVF
jgi:hypothetical protein